MKRWLVCLCLCVAPGCKSATGAAAGEPCSASSECAAGLVCDFNAPGGAVCAGMLTPQPDAPPPDLPDAPPMIDAPPGTPDAPPVPDAPPGTPDAPPVPDAPPSD